LLSFPVSQAVTCPPLLLLVPWPSPDPDISHEFGHGSTLSDLFLYVKPTSQHSSLNTLMMEAVRISETLVNVHQPTWRYNPEDSHLLYINTVLQQNNVL
jgi:hypothetical protein